MPLDPLTANATGAVLLLVAVDASLNAYSAINSSPWTSESFGGDPEKAKSCMKYVKIADATTIGLGLLAMMISRSPWPMIGAILVVALMHWLYMRALSVAKDSGSKGW